MYKFIIPLIILAVSCTPSAPQRVQKTPLVGQGSSFSIPMSSRLFHMAEKELPITIDFTANSSYQGIQQIIDGTVDFAISEVFLTDKQVADNPNILHIPIAVAGVNFAYNIPGEDFSLHNDPVYLNADIIAKILNKQITRWNDPAIVALNQNVAENKTRVFPNLPITVIYREGVAGDTYLLSKFLTKANPQWAKQHGIISNFNWTPGIGESSALDMMKALLKTEGAFTYTTMVYGIQNNIPLARILNNFGVYGRGCNFRSTEAMKAAYPRLDNRVDLTFPTELKLEQGLEIGRESAVATSFMYVLVRKDQNYNGRTKEQAQALVNLIAWLLSPVSQRELEPIFFAALTKEFRNSSFKTLAQMNYDGEALSPQLPKAKKKKK